MAATRPTAVNLFWAVERMKGVFETSKNLPIEKIKKGSYKRPSSYTQKTYPCAAS